MFRRHFGLTHCPLGKQTKILWEDGHLEKLAPAALFSKLVGQIKLTVRAVLPFFRGYDDVLEVFSHLKVGFSQSRGVAARIGAGRLRRGLLARISFVTASATCQKRAAAHDGRAHQGAPLQEFLTAIVEIENYTVEGNIESAKLAVIREKRRRYSRLL